MFGENLIQVAKACKRLKPFVADKKSTKEAIKQICLSRVRLMRLTLMLWQLWMRNTPVRGSA